MPGNRETALRNLKKRGAQANPNGRPKLEWTWSGELKKALEKAGKDKRLMKELVTESLVAQALKGNVLAHKTIMDRMEGMPAQSNLIGNLDDKKFEVEVVESKPNIDEQ